MQHDSDRNLDRLFQSLAGDAPAPHAGELVELLASDRTTPEPVDGISNTTQRKKGRHIMISSIAVLLTTGLLYLASQLSSHSSAPNSGLQGPRRLQASNTNIVHSAGEMQTGESAGRKSQTPKDTIHIQQYPKPDITYSTPIPISDDEFAKLGIRREPSGSVLLADGEEGKVVFSIDTLPVRQSRFPNEPIIGDEVPFVLFPQFVTDSKGNLLMIGEHTSEGGGLISRIKLPAGLPSVLTNLPYVRSYLNSAWGNTIDSSVIPAVETEHYKVTVGIMMIDTTISYPAHDYAERDRIQQMCLAAATEKDSIYKHRFGNDDGLRARFGLSMSVDRRTLSPIEQDIFSKLDEAAALGKTELERLQLQDEEIWKVMEDKVIPDTTKLRFEQVGRSLDYRRYLIQQRQDEQNLAQINTFVPILVRPNTGSLPKENYDNGLLFWYKPTPELFKALPKLPNQDNLSVRATGVDDLEKINVYPNPAFMYLYTNYTLKHVSSVRIELRDLLGHTVLATQELTHASGVSFSSQLDVSPLPSGVYLLVLTTDRGEAAVRRVLISRP